jgi:hypothetical protein
VHGVHPAVPPPPTPPRMECVQACILPAARLHPSVPPAPPCPLEIGETGPTTRVHPSVPRRTLMPPLNNLHRSSRDVHSCRTLMVAPCRAGAMVGVCWSRVEGACWCTHGGAGAAPRVARQATPWCRRRAWAACRTWARSRSAQAQGQAAARIVTAAGVAAPDKQDKSDKSKTRARLS